MQHKSTLICELQHKLLADTSSVLTCMQIFWHFSARALFLQGLDQICFSCKDKKYFTPDFQKKKSHQVYNWKLAKEDDRLH